MWGAPLKVPASAAFRAGWAPASGQGGHARTAPGGGARTRGALTVGRWPSGAPGPREEGCVCRAERAGSLAVLRDRDRERRTQARRRRTPSRAAAARTPETHTRRDAWPDARAAQLQPRGAASPAARLLGLPWSGLVRASSAAAAPGQAGAAEDPLPRSAGESAWGCSGRDCPRLCPYACAQRNREVPCVGGAEPELKAVERLSTGRGAGG